jgi:hypothetical protein
MNWMFSNRFALNFQHPYGWKSAEKYDRRTLGESAKRFSCDGSETHSEANIMLRTILVIFLILALLGSLPAWPYSTGWGYYPSGGLGLLLVVILIFAILDGRSTV